MKKSKWFTISCILGIGLSISSNVFAKASGIIVNGADSKLYQYDYIALKSSAVASVTGDTNGAKLYNDFLARKKTIKAYYDDMRKSYVDFNEVSNSAKDFVLSGKTGTFDFKGFLENSTTSTIDITPVKITSDNSEQATDTAPSIDMSSIKCYDQPNNCSTLVTFKLINIPNGEDLSKYNITVKGIKASTNPKDSTGIFAVTIGKKITPNDLTISDFFINKKSENTVITISKINSIAASVDQGGNYSLPNAVIATMSDGTAKYVAVTWDKTVDTSIGGTYTFNGTVSGYNSKVVLTLTVNVVQPPYDTSKTGNIKGIVTWQYNNFIGTKPDVGAKIALIPKNLNKNSDNGLFAVLGEQIPNGKNGIYTGKADGYGNYEIDDVPVGNYYLLIMSNKTRSDMTIDAYTNLALGTLFSTDDWNSMQTMLKLNKYDLEEIQIKENKTITESHDFGFTYFLNKTK